MGLTKYEQEVVINFNAEEETASVYTANPVWIRKMDKLVENNPEEFKFIKAERLDGAIISKKYECPKKLISVRSGTTKRELTEEQKKAVAERLMKGRS